MRIEGSGRGIVPTLATHPQRRRRSRRIAIVKAGGIRKGTGGAELASVLHVDDDPAVGTVVRRLLARELGLRAEHVSTADEALRRALPGRFELVLIDWMLGPASMSGLEVCRRVRADDASVNLVMLTVRAGVDDKIAALDAGADEYVVKGNVQELVSQLRALLRRSARKISGTFATLPINPGITVNTRTGKVTGPHGETCLTRTELRILLHLHETGTVASTMELAAAVLGRKDPASQNLAHKHVSKLRAKLRKTTGAREMIEHLPMGYAMRREGVWHG
jgi:DNA-binding response OmpR family regulator